MGEKIGEKGRRGKEERVKGNSGREKGEKRKEGKRE